MLSGGKQINFTGETRKLLTAARDKNISVFGLQLGERVLVADELKKGSLGPLVYICEDEFAAKKAYAQFSALSQAAVLLPAKDDVLTYARRVSSQNHAARLAALTRAVSNPDCIVVTGIEAACQLFPPRGAFSEAVINFEQGKDYDVIKVAENLVRAGYRRSGTAVAEGEFSLRGDILDIVPAGFTGGVRLEFFGDTLESIRRFDPYDLKSGEPLAAVTAGPFTEVFYADGEAAKILGRALAEIPKPCAEGDLQAYHALVSSISTDLESGSRDMRLSFLMPLLPHGNLVGFINPSRVVFDDARAVADRLSHIYAEHENRCKAALVRGEILKSSVYQLTAKETALCFSRPCLAFHARDSQNRIFAPEQIFNFKSMQVPSYRRNFESLCDDVRGWMSNGFTIVIYAGSHAARENLLQFFAREKPLDTGGKGSLEVTADILPESAVFFEEKLILIATSALVSNSEKKVIRRGKRDAFLEPAVGSYVVHQYHGVGFCESVTRLSVGGAERDYAVIRYAGGDKLYVPVENMDSLSRYGEGESEPKLSKIGGAEFARVKERVRSSVAKMAFDLSELYANRGTAAGHRYSENAELDEEFAAEFPFNETEDQLTAAKECIGDLTSGKVMDRLLCGDVGYGKTEVALRAAFKVVCEGKQVAFLAPTTILARQHFHTAKKRMKPFGVSVASLTRFDSDKEIAAALADLAGGRADIVCGTHRMLSKDVAFKDLGLLILDEEQRFGVADKEKIKTLKTNVNVLTLSATPIPRTLHLSLTGIRDISLLDTPPEERLPIKTYVTEYTEGLLYDAVTRELGRGGQVFIVYNRVATIDRFAAGVQNLLGKDVRVAVAHGQMGGDRLENVIAEFTDGKYDVLVASTIIENGIDMPNANTMVVIDSDCFGLSQLYQLRGRVGRSNRLAHVYFTYDGRKVLTENAYKRLDAITQFTEFGSGFKIAMRDLEIRGAGNILGREQHGHIEKVGYDMYYKILAETVGAIKGKTPAGDLPDVKVTTDFNAFLPESYIEDKEQRVRVYSRIAAIASIAERKDLAGELKEVYGPVPAPADNLMLVALLKNLAAKIGAESLTVKKTECFVKFPKTADIPKTAAAFFPAAKVIAPEAKVWFGADRVNLMKFLLG